MSGIAIVERCAVCDQPVILLSPAQAQEHERRAGERCSGSGAPPRAPTLPRGDGFYVDADGHTRACRTGALVERPSSVVVEGWATILEAARKGMALYIGEYDGVDDADEAMRAVVAAMQPWRERASESA